MKVVSINGSPKGKNSNTNVMIESLEKGMQENNNEIVNIYLSEKDIQYCKGCYSCWFKTPGKCVILIPAQVRKHMIYYSHESQRWATLIA